MLEKKDGRNSGLKDHSSSLWVLFIIISLLVLAGFVAALGIWRGGTSSDGAAWLQAAGTLVAISVAVWVTKIDTRQTKRWRRIQGEEAAWSARFMIVQAQLDAHIVAYEITKDASSRIRQDVALWIQRMQASALALEAIGSRADHVHPGVIFMACNARVLVNDLINELRAVGEEVAKHGKAADEQIRRIVVVHISLQELIEQFDARMIGVVNALNRGGDMLPVQWSVGCEGESNNIG